MAMEQGIDMESDEAVKTARDMFEYVEETLLLPRHLKARVIGKNYRNMIEMLDKSGVDWVKIDDYNEHEAPNRQKCLDPQSEVPFIFAGTIKSITNIMLLIKDHLNHPKGEEEGKEELPNGQSLENIVSPLAEICTYELLDQARRRKYGEDYSVWPEQWPNRGEELLALDRAARVPNDTPETKLVGDLVFSFVQRLAQILPKEKGTHDVKVMPIGSFPIDCEVGDIDEFDFLLVGTVFSEGDIIRLILDATSPSPLESCDGVRVASAYRHGPAVCVELGWTCGRGHEHFLGIDLTPAKEETCLQHLQFLQASRKRDSGPFTERVLPPFDQLVDRISSEHPHSPKSYGIAPEVTSAAYDRHLMDSVRGVSETILPVNRLFKLLCGHLLPHRVHVDDSIKRVHTSCDVSSHALKSIVYKHVMSHPTGEEWSVDHVPVRLAEMLQRAQREYVIDIIIGDGLHPYRWYKKEIAAMVSYLTTTPTPSMLFPSMKHDLSDCVLVRDWGEEKDLLKHRCTESQLPKLPHTFICIYPRSSLSPGPQPYSAHPLMVWCRAYLHGLYEANPGADLTHIPNGYLYHVFQLYRGGYLTLSDFPGKWKEKLSIFKHCWSVCANDSLISKLPLREVTDWCGEFPAADLGPLYRHGDREEEWDILRDKLSEQGQRLWKERPNLKPVPFSNWTVRLAVICTHINRQPKEIEKDLKQIICPLAENCINPRDQTDSIMAELNRKFTDGELAGDYDHNRESVQLLSRYKVTRSEQYVVKHKTKEDLKAAYGDLYETQDVKPEVKKAALAAPADLPGECGKVEQGLDSEIIKAGMTGKCTDEELAGDTVNKAEVAEEIKDQASPTFIVKESLSLVDKYLIKYTAKGLHLAHFRNVYATKEFNPEVRKAASAAPAYLPGERSILEQVTDTEAIKHDLEEIVSPLAEICMYELVDRARRRKYGDDYCVWPEKWSNRGEELLALDRAAHVPNDTPETNHVGDLVLSFVQRLALLLWKESTFEFKVIPYGSFPSNCKVGDMNEFDFLLCSAECTPMISKEIFYILRKYLSPLEANDGVRVTTVYTHGPAVCVELGWTCGGGHEHSLGVDMTPAQEYPDLSRESNSLGERRFRAAPPLDHLECSISRDHPPNMYVIYIRKGLAETSAMYDRQRLDSVRDVSENILPVYRLLKVLCKHLLTHWVGLDNGPKGYHTSCNVSSHCLKTYVYDHLLSHRTAEEWSVDNIPVRLAEILRLILEVEMKDIVNGKILYSGSVFKHEIEALAGHISTNAASSVSSSSLNSDLSDCLLVTEERGGEGVQIHRCNEIIWNCSIYPRSSVSPDPQPYSSHPLMEWCRAYIHSLYEAHPGADLTAIPDGDLRTVYMLYREDYLTLSEVQNEWKEKLSKLRHFCRQGDVSELSLVRVNSMLYNYSMPRTLGKLPPSYVTDWCEKFPATDLGPLYKYGDDKWDWDKLRDILSEQGRRLWDKRPNVRIYEIPRAVVYTVLHRKR